MELKDFIRETLVGIARGIQEAQVETGDVWAISPSTVDGKRIVEKSYVEFDIAITVGEVSNRQKEGSGGLKGEISVLGAKIGGELDGGGKATNEARSENFSRVSFKVPVHMNAQFTNPVATKVREEYLKAKGAATISTAAQKI